MAAPPPVSSVEQADAQGLPRRFLDSLNAVLSPTADALRQGLTLSENFACYVKTQSVTVPSDWTSLTLVNSWASHPSYVPAAYRVDAFGRVIFRGALQRLSAPGFASNMATGLPLPAGRHPYGPATDAGLGAVDLTADGALTYFGGGYDRVSLQDVEYDAASRLPPAWATPVDVILPRKFPGKPAFVFIGRAEETSGGVVGLACCPGWSIAELKEQRRAVRFPRLDGLAPGHTYSLTFVVLAE